ncbi:MAG: hypothetical protein PHD32_08440 [Eubacteriales bacterium]|nr:hypothetical protein [Eubacteriales bacterium]
MLRKIIPHATIILATMMLVFFCIDRVNTAMAFINNDITKWLLCLFSICAIATSVYLIASDRRRRR